MLAVRASGVHSILYWRRQQLLMLKDTSNTGGVERKANRLAIRV